MMDRVWAFCVAAAARVADDPLHSLQEFLHGANPEPGQMPLTLGMPSGMVLLGSVAVVIGAGYAAYHLRRPLAKLAWTGIVALSGALATEIAGHYGLVKRAAQLVYRLIG